MGRKRTAAIVLWLVLAFAWWNVVFDRTLVLAGRRYVHAAVLADRAQRPPERAADWMGPAISRGAMLASTTAGGILIAGFALLAAASRSRPVRLEEPR